MAPPPAAGRAGVSGGAGRRLRRLCGIHHRHGAGAGHRGCVPGRLPDHGAGRRRRGDGDAGGGGLQPGLRDPGPDSGGLTERLHRHRGRAVLAAPRHRPPGYRPGRLAEPDLRRTVGGRQHHHPAAHQEQRIRRRHGGAHGAGQNPEENPGAVSGPAAGAADLQGVDPGELPEHHQPGRRHLGRPDGGHAVLRKGGVGADAVGVRRAGGHHQEPQLLQPPEKPGGQPGAAGAGPCQDAGTGHDLSGGI